MPCLLTHLLLDKMAAILAEDNFKCILWMKMIENLIWISLKLVPRSSIDNKPALVEIRLVAWWAPSHYLNQCWNIVNWTLRNKLQWNLNRNSYISFKKMHFKMPSGKWRPFCLGLNFLGRLDQNNGCWCCVCSSHQGISSHDIEDIGINRALSSKRRPFEIPQPFWCGKMV